MANARALDKRRKSIKNIRKITRTMELIATARFKQAMDRASAATEYTNRITGLVANLANTGMELRAGMTFTIEPMINSGKYDIKMLNDGWTAVTKDKSLFAQFEHTLGITENCYEIFTESAKGYSKPPYL